MVLDKGEVLEMGSHNELMSNPVGHYRKLYEMQFEKVLAG
jgi:ABC-type multidrug transport system fused ATPase/permease subunit